MKISQFFVTVPGNDDGLLKKSSCSKQMPNKDAHETMDETKLSLNTPRKANTSRQSRPKEKIKTVDRNRAYGVRKNSLSRSLSEITNTVSRSPKTSPRRSSVCYMTPAPDQKSACPQILITQESDGESTKEKFINAVKKVIKTRAQSADCKREYDKLKAEIQTMSHVGRREIVIVQEGRISPMPEIEAEPRIMSFPFGADENADDVDGRSCEHEGCLQALVTPRSKTGARICLLSAVARLVAKRPKTIKELKRNPITTADEKLLREKKESEDTGNGYSDTESEGEPLAHLQSCRYLRGTKEDKELSMEEIFN